MSALAGSGHVRAEYRHIQKRVRSRPGLSVEGAVLKWYDIAPADEPVPAAVRSLARTDLWAACAAKTVALSDDLGFIILHRCGPDFYFLITCTWRNDNELWETVWAKTGPADAAFAPWPAAGPHRPAFCVWELGAVCHEQDAWSRYLLSERDADARRAYLEAGLDATV
ncbi:MAG: hypothetical protein ABJB93_03075 [Gaiellales bacterium]